MAIFHQPTLSAKVTRPQKTVRIDFPMALDELVGPLEYKAT